MNLIRSLSIYTSTNILLRAIPFILVPLLTLYLSPKDYGILSLVNTTVEFTTPFVLCGIGSALYLEYFKIPQNKLPEYITSILTIPLFSYFILTILFIIFQNLLNIKLLKNIYYIIPLFCLIQVLPYINGIIYQVTQKPLYYGKFFISISIVNIYMAYILIVIVGMKWEGRLISIYLTHFIFSIVAFINLVRMKFLVRKINMSFLKSSLLIGLPLIPHEIGFFIINLSDRYFIAKMVNIESLGIYTISYQIGLIMNIFVGSLNQAWTPQLFEKLKDNNIIIKNNIIKKSYLFATAFIIVFILIVAITPYIYKFLINSRYHSGREYVLWIALSYVFYGFYTLVVNYIYYSRKTYILFILTALISLLNLLLNYLFIKCFGVIGAAYSTFICYFIFFFVAWIISCKIYPMPWFCFYK